MKAHDTFLTYLALATAAFFWGLSFVATKIALQSFSPFCLIFFRFFSAALFFVVLLWHTGFPSLTKKTFRSLLVLALMEPGLYFLFETFGLQYTSATKTSLIIATIPVVVLVLSSFFLKERLRPINMLGIAVSLAGVALLVFGGRPQIGLKGMMFGDMLIFGAVIAASVYMILTRKLGESLSSLQITGMQIIFGALLFLPLFLWDLPHLDWQSVTKNSLMALIVLTIFATIGAFLCYNFALTRIPAAQAAVCINGIPLVTACGAWVLLGETLTSMQFFGGALVLVAVFLANYAPKIDAVPELAH